MSLFETDLADLLRLAGHDGHSVEATPGIEPGYADLQSTASALRHVAIFVNYHGSSASKKQIDAVALFPRVAGLKEALRLRRNIL